MKERKLMPTYWVNIYAEPQIGHILTYNWVNFPKMPTYWVNIYAEPHFGHILTYNWVNFPQMPT